MARFPTHATRSTVYRLLGPAFASVKSTRIFSQLNVTKASRSTIWYWRRRELDPTFHNGGWGGHRWQKFPNEVVAAISMLIWAILSINPTTKVWEYVKLLNTPPFSFGVTRSWILALFRSWKWTWKRPVLQQLVSRLCPIHVPNLTSCFMFALS
jgi:hypothetical protein